MPVIWIPSLLRSLTNGRETVNVPGETVRQVIENLETQFPGVKARLCEDDLLRRDISVIVNGQVSIKRMRQPLEEDSEVHFLPAISGG